MKIKAALSSTGNLLAGLVEANELSKVRTELEEAQKLADEANERVAKLKARESQLQKSLRRR
jgi:capsule polysaccharide export protein KpsE/RkpR